MNRRDLLKGAIIASTATATGVAAEENSRLFGTPNSAIPGNVFSDRRHRLKLSMSKNNIPSSMWNRFENLSDFWQEVSTNPDRYKMAREIAISRNADLGNFLNDKRFDTDEHKILLKLSDPDLLKYAAQGDYLGLLSEMNSRGLLELGDKLADDFVKAIKQDEEIYESLRADFQAKFAEHQLLEGGDLMDDLKFFRSKIIPSEAFNVRNNAVAAAAVAVVVGVAVATYAIAAVNVAVGLNVVAAISVAVQLAVCGATCHGRYPMSENMKKDIGAISLLAKKTNNPQLVERSIVELHCKEAALCLGAAEKLGLIHIKDDDKKEVYQRMYNIIRVGLKA